MSTKGSTNAHKDVIYIDVDDEITGIIDKVRGSDKKIVALVLPKRATVFQSVVNMKLLKRATEESKKHVVLITSEAGLLPLAGAVGIHIAKSLNSKPEMPDAPKRQDDDNEAVQDDNDDDKSDVSESNIDRSKTVGELAGATALEGEIDDADDSIELGDDDDETDLPDATESKPKKFKKKFNIPDFNKFRVVLALGVVGAILLISFIYAALVVMPKATITIKTDSTAVNTSKVLTVKTGDDVKLDTAGGIIPAQAQQVQKTLEQKVDATGTKNNGEKATGTVKLSLTDCSKDQVTVPAGTGLSANGKTFITKNSATLESVKIGNACKNGDFPNFSTENVDVAAQTGGSGYNIGASSFTVSGFSNVTGQSSATMTGGTDDVQKIVTQNDIDSAKQKIGAQDTTTIQTELKNTLEGRSLFPLVETFNAAEPETKQSVDAGAVADSVTVSQTITYTMLGVQQTDLQAVIAESVKGDIDTKKQKITSYGFNNAAFSLTAVNPDGATLSMQTKVVAGAQLDVNAIRKQVAGKKGGDARDLIKANPGVTDVDVSYSPFWVGSIPKKASKITIVIEEPKVTKTTHAESSSH